MPGIYVREFEEVPSLWRSIIPWGGAGGGEIGNAVFCKFPISNYRSVSLPLSPPLTYEGKTLLPELIQPRIGSRKAQVFEIGFENILLSVVSVHLELWRSGWEHRRTQLEAACDGIKGGPLLVAGDFNTVGGSLWSTLFRRHGMGEVARVRAWLKARNLADPFSDAEVTSGRLGINAKIDWLAASPELKVKAAWSIRTAFSDHCCLVVDYDVPVEVSVPIPE
jgi:endonuclease/exonuclease/phosphatase family metal-dependent hydrolase